LRWPPGTDRRERAWSLLFRLTLVLFAVYMLPSRPLVFLAAVATCLIQPFGLSLVSYPLPSLSGGAVPIQEFSRTNLLGQPVLLATVVGLALLVDWRKVDLRSALIAGGSAGLALLAVRHIPLFYCLGIPALAPSFRGVATAEEARVSADRNRVHSRPEHGWFLGTAPSCSACSGGGGPVLEGAECRSRVPSQRRTLR